MAPLVPFVIVPPSTTAEDLQRERPFLLKSILAVTSRKPRQQLTLATSLVRQLAERVAVNGERNLDLLLGVLILTGWCFYNAYHVPQWTCLLSLGMVLVFDLGLNRPLSDSTSKRLFETAFLETNNTGFSHFSPHAKKSRTLEERRALLGKFFLSSTASKHFRSRIDPLRVTPYIYECMEILEKSQDQLTDTCAISLVRLQLIVERATQGPWNTDYGFHEHFGSAPPILYVKSLQEQLKTFRSSMPSEVSMRRYMLIHYYHVEESVYEVGLSRSPVLENLPRHDFQRLELLYACLESNKKFWETYFSIPETDYVYFSVATWSQVSHSAIILQLLSSFEHPDWNLAYVRETIDFLGVLDSLILRFNRIEDFFFARAAAKLARVKAHIQEKWACSNANGSPGSPTSGEDADFGRTWDPVVFLDESWLGDFLGPMEF